MQKFAQAKATEYMAAMLGGDEKLCKTLIPQFPLGTRRITPAPGYLEALRAPNTEVITEGISSVVAEGIQLESGEIIKLDAIICATGFDNTFVPRFPIVGRYGNVQDRMRAETPKGYMSVALPGVPNYFSKFSTGFHNFLACLLAIRQDGAHEREREMNRSLVSADQIQTASLGPNAPIGHGSVFTLLEHVARYVARMIRKCQTEGIRAAAPSDAAVTDYAEHVAAFMPRTAWAAPGRSWFKGGREDGPVTALHPGSRVHFFHMLERPRGEDWDFTYDFVDGGERGSGNRFFYLGNGFSTRELVGPDTFDSTWYLDEEEAEKLS